jgi:hypothetical protein
MAPRFRVVMRPVFVAVLLAACGGSDECIKDGFGRQCGSDGTYLKCGRTSCEDSYGFPCSEHTVIDELSCPAHSPVCRDKVDGSEPDVMCVGDNIGSCEDVGFVRCEDQHTVVACLRDELGVPFLSRGTCEDGDTCYEPFPLHAGGCTDLVPP